MSTKRSLALLGASTMLLSILPAAAFAADSAKVTVDQLDATKSPQEISALWAKVVGKADTVIVATDENFPDSLASGALQGQSKAPLFFVGKTLDAVTKKAIQDLGAKNAVILGEDKAVVPAVEADLKALGLSTARVGGVARVETSVALAEKTGAKDDTVILARQDNYADAIAAGATAAKTGHPVVVLPGQPYVDGTGATINLHPVVADYLKTAGIKHVVVVGGEQAVSAPVFNAVKNVVADTVRVGGATRTETAAELAKTWGTVTRATVVDGYQPEALGYYNGFAAALTAATNNAPVVLSNDKTAALDGVSATSGVAAYCGTLVNSAVCSQLATKLKATTTPVTLKEAPAVKELMISPQDVETVIGSAKTKPARVYTVMNAKPGVKYTISVVKAEMKDGKYVAKQDKKGATTVDTAAAVTVVNGIATDGSSVQADANGKITFTVEANKDGQNTVVVPVISEAKKALAFGGALVIKPTEVPNRGMFIGKVVAVDKAAKTLTLKGFEQDSQNWGTGETNFTVNYGAAGDQFAESAYQTTGQANIGTFDAGKQLSAKQFDDAVSVGDIVASKVYYDAASGLASQITFQDVLPPVVEAGKVDVTALQNAANFKITDSSLLTALDGGQVEVRYAQLTNPITPEMEAGTVPATTDEAAGPAKFVYGYAAFNKNEESFNQISYTQTPKGSVSGSDDEMVMDKKTISDVKTVLVSNTSKDASKSFEFTVDGLEPSTSYAFTYRVVAANGDKGPWNVPTTDSVGTAVTSNTQANFESTTKSTITGTDLTTPKKTTDVVRTTPEPVELGIASVDRVGDPINDGRNTTDKLLITLTGDAYKGGTIDPDKITVTASTGGKVTVTKAGSNASNYDDKKVADKTFQLTLASALSDVENDITYTVNFEQGALTNAKGAPSLPATISFKY